MGGLPDDVRVEVEFEATVWTDITAYVNLGESSIQTGRGRGNAYEQAQTGGMSMRLMNTDGRFTPKLAAGAYYPNVKENKRVRVIVEHNSTDHYLFTGYIDSWDAEFPAAGEVRTDVTVTASDRFKLLARRQFRSTYEEVARAAGADAYYPLSSDDSDSTASEVTDLIRTDGAGRIVSPKSNVDARQKYISDDDVAGLYLNGALSFTGALSAAYGEGAGVVRFDPVVDQSASGYTVSMGVWFRTTDTTFPILFALGRGIVQLYTGGVVRSKFSGTALATSTTVVNDGEWHHVLTVFEATGSAFDVAMYVDGVLEDTGTSASSLGQVLKRWILNGDTGATLDEDDDTAQRLSRKAAYSGDVDYAGLVLSSSDMGASAADLYAAGRNGLDGEAADDRAARVLGWCGITDPADYDLAVDTTATIGSQDVEGQSALDALQDIARAEAAPLFIAGDGKVTMQSRARRSTFTPVATFDGAGSEVDVASVRLTLADEGVVNQVTGQVTGGPAAVVFVSDVMVDVMTDEMSAADLSPIGVTVEAPWSTLDQARDAAARHLAENYEARPRFGQITLTPFRATADIWADCLSLEIGDLIRVTGLPAEYVGRLQLSTFIESLSWDISMNDITLTLDTTALDYALGEVRFDDDLTGRFGHDAGVMTVGTVSALSGTGTGTFTIDVASGPLWSTDSADYPIFVKIDEEELTISGIAGTSSPQTVTVSERGSNGTVAAAHTTGTVVDLWPVPVFAL